jgi:RNA polymerase sigma-70 factor (ECF subfamily)
MITMVSCGPHSLKRLAEQSDGQSAAVPEHRQKRGGEFTFISLEQQTPEERYHLEPADHDTPEKKFLRQWALTVLKQTMDALEVECETGGKAALFQEVKNLLSGEREAGTYAGISQRLAMNEGAVRVAVHRLRQRYGETVRDQIARIVPRPEEIDEELRFHVEQRTAENIAAGMSSEEAAREARCRV